MTTAPVVESTSRPEYTWCVDSHNALKPVANPDNPTNNIVIPCKSMPYLKNRTFQIFLGSIELPVLAQYLIEQQWNHIYFSQNIYLNMDDESQSGVREFEFIIHDFLNNQVYPLKAIIPILFNPIIDIDASDPTNPIFTTQFEHGLDTIPQWDWVNGRIRVISTPLPYDETQLVDPIILSPTMFQLQNVSNVAYPLVGSYYGYLHAPPITSPLKLAEIVQLAIQSAIITYDSVHDTQLQYRFHIKLEYNVEYGLFQISYTDSQYIFDPKQPVSSIEIISNIYNLSALMGFGYSNFRISPNSLEPFSGTYGFQCMSILKVAPNDYTDETLTSQLNFQWNRLSFDGGCSNLDANRPVLVLSSSTGECFNIPIAFGSYTPDTFAQYLESQMNALDPNGDTYRVIWDNSKSQFIFESMTNKIFGFEFTNTTNTLNPAIIGFDYISYRGLTQYASPNLVQVPTMNCCNLSLRYNTNWIQPRMDSKFFTFYTQPAKRIADGLATYQSNGICELTSNAPALAHGLQVDDAVQVQIADGTQYVFRVVEVVNAFTVLFDIGTVSTLTTASNLAVSFGQADTMSLNFYYSGSSADGNANPLRQRLPNILYPKFLGFDYRDMLYPGPWTQLSNMSMIKSPFRYNLNPANYLLMVLDQPSCRTHSNHAWGEKIQPNLFAKIILYPTFRLERNYPMIAYMSGVEPISQIQVRILNPEYTEYQFHGVNWSCTINFVMTETQATFLIG